MHRWVIVSSCLLAIFLETSLICSGAPIDHVFKYRMPDYRKFWAPPILKPALPKNESGIMDPKSVEFLQSFVGSFGGKK